MKLKISLACLLLVLAGCVMPPPPGFTWVESETARVEAYGFSMQVPGKGWMQGKNNYGVIFGNRIPPVVSYAAGLSVNRVPGLTDRKAFHDFVKKKMEEGSDSYRFKIVRNDFKEEEKDGLLLAVGRIDFDDSGAVNVGANAFLATRTATLYAWDPHDPERLIAVWYSWRGVKFEEAAFAAEAARFLGSLQKAKGG